MNNFSTEKNKNFAKEFSMFFTLKKNVVYYLEISKIASKESSKFRTCIMFIQNLVKNPKKINPSVSANILFPKIKKPTPSQ